MRSIAAEKKNRNATAGCNGKLTELGEPRAHASHRSICFGPSGAGRRVAWLNILGARCARLLRPVEKFFPRKKIKHILPYHPSPFGDSKQWQTSMPSWTGAVAWRYASCRFAALDPPRWTPRQVAEEETDLLSRCDTTRSRGRRAGDGFRLRKRDTHWRPAAGLRHFVPSSSGTSRPSLRQGAATAPTVRQQTTARTISEAKAGNIPAPAFCTLIYRRRKRQNCDKKKIASKWWRSQNLRLKTTESDKSC